MSQEFRALSGRDSVSMLSYEKWSRELEGIENASLQEQQTDRANFEAEAAVIKADLRQEKASFEQGLNQNIHEYMSMARKQFEKYQQEIIAARLDKLSQKYQAKAKASQVAKDDQLLKHFDKSPFRSKQLQRMSQQGADGRPDSRSLPPERSTSIGRAPSHEQSPGRYVATVDQPPRAHEQPQHRRQVSGEHPAHFLGPPDMRRGSLVRPSGPGPQMLPSSTPRSEVKPQSRSSLDDMIKRKALDAGLSPQPSSPKRIRTHDVLPSQHHMHGYHYQQNAHLPSHSHHAQARRAPEPPTAVPQRVQLPHHFVGHSPTGRPLQAPADPSVQRSEATPAKTPETVQRTISFDEVYQNGKPQHYHTIVEFPPKSGMRYILKCEKHYVHFKENPIAGAAKHLFGAQHPGSNKRHDNAISQLGFLIPGCTAEMAEKNNAMSAAAYARGYKPFNLNRLNRTERMSLNLPLQEDVPDAHRQAGGLQPIDRSALSAGASAQKMLRPKPTSPLRGAMPIPRSAREFSGINDPVPGELYLGYWSSTKTYYSIMVYPIRGAIPIKGVHRTLMGSGLEKAIPRCYMVDKASREIVGWAAGYEDGGEFMNGREFPVAFLDVKKQVGWLPAKHIRPFNFESPIWKEIPYYMQARDEYALVRGFANYAELKAKRGVPPMVLGRRPPVPVSEVNQRSELGVRRPESASSHREHEPALAAAAVDDVEMSDGEDPKEADADSETGHSVPDNHDSPYVDPDSDSEAPMDLESEAEAGLGETPASPGVPDDGSVDAPAHTPAAAEEAGQPEAAASPKAKTASRSPEPAQENPAGVVGPDNDGETIKDSISVAISEMPTPRGVSEDAPTLTAVSVPVTASAARFLAAQALSMGSPPTPKTSTTTAPTPTATAPTSPTEAAGERSYDARPEEQQSSRLSGRSARRALPSSRNSNSLQPDDLAANRRSSVEKSMPPAVGSSNSGAPEHLTRQLVADKGLTVPERTRESNGPTPPDSPPMVQRPEKSKSGGNEPTTIVAADPLRRSTASPAPLTSSTSATSPLSRHSTPVLRAELRDRWNAIRSTSTPLAQSPVDSPRRTSSTASPTVAGFFKTEPSAETTRDQLFDLAAYSCDSTGGAGGGVSYASGPNGGFLRLATSTEQGVVETTAGSAVRVGVRPAEVSGLVLAVLDDSSFAARVTVVPRAADGPTQHLTFARNPEDPSSKVGKVQARQFIVWVRALNPAVTYSTSRDSVRRGSVASRSSVNSMRTAAIELD